MPIFMSGSSFSTTRRCCDDRFEFVVDDVGGVDLFVHVAGDDAFGELEDAALFELEQHAGMVAGDFDRRLALADLAG